MIYFPIKYNIYICYCDCFGRNVATLQNILIHTYLPNSYYTSNEAIRVQTDYDVIDRPIATHWADGAESSISYGIGDDAFGVSRLLQNRTDENGKEWQQYTSPQGWLTTSIAPDEATTTFRYDPLGQLLQSTDPDGLTTIHIYDGFGRRTKRVHPDAGTTHWTYDAAGNMIASATNLQLNRGEQTTYEYDYTRPVHIHYPQYPQNDVYYTYDSVGRLSMVRDVTGTERMEYDDVGNVSLSERTIVIPTELTAYRFATHFSYDAFGRMQQITYPDGEIVNYHYSNGLLHYVDGNASAPYIQSIDYDEYDAPIYIQYGNGLTSDIAYDEVRRWTVARSLRDENNDYLQDISYHYDNVGNITQIEQDAPPYDNMGGEYMVTYTYDNQYRLIDAAQRNSFVGNYDYTMAYSPSGVVDTKYSPETGTDITFGYTQGYNNSAFYSHQPQMAYSSTEEDIMMFRWDWNGQLTHIGRPYTEQFRRHVWNEAGQLAAVFGNEYCGYYAYDAKGNRAYKLTGSVVEDQHNAGYPSYTAYFDNATMYVNPYMVVTPQGYTKHYYNGSQRIASRLGNYWELEDPSVDAEDELATADSLWQNTTTIIEPSHQDMEGDYQYIQADGSNLPIVSYGPYISSIRGFHAEDILWGVFSGSCRADDDGMTDDGVFYYHPDHLGSTTWITSDRGQVVQYLHYMPFGELWESQQVSEYDERFKFTGKERDTETGYDYFGARYYLSLLGIWLSPDPFIDKNVGISSYAFCSWNPINRLDPNGMDDIEIDKRGFIINYEKTNYNDNICIKDSDDPQWERELSLPGQYISESFSAERLTVKGDFVQMDFLPISDDAIGEQIFSFVADNTDVEWSLNYIGEQGTILSTSHQERSEAGCSYIFNRYSMRGHTHSHPFSITPSTSDKQWAQKMLEKYPLAPLKIYYYGTLYNYNAQGLVAPNVK